MKHLKWPIKKSFLIFIFLYATFTINADNNLFHKADSLFDAGNYFRSVIEYERVIFENSEISVQREALLRKSRALRHDNRFELAINELNKIAVRHINDPIIAERTWELALCHHLNMSYNEAIATIEMYMDGVKEKQILADLLILKALSHNHLFEFEEAGDIFQTLLTNEEYQAPELKAVIQEVYINENTPRYRNPERAHNLSMIIPGTGHAYAGAIGEGAVSFLLNASALSFGVWQVYSGYYLTGYVVGVTFLERFHTGGKKRAENLAKQKNIENSNRLNNQILEAISN